MTQIKFLTLLGLMVFLISCGGDDTTDTPEIPGKTWEIKLNGTDFNLPNTGLAAYYDTFSGDFTIGGTKSISTDERIVFTFSVANGAPFVEGQTLDMGPGSEHAILYFDGQGNNYSSRNAGGSGLFKVEQYIETETRTFLSGTANGLLFTPGDSTAVVVTGFVGASTF
jgi:hypothetical protein